MATFTEQLAAVNVAIAKAEVGQETRQPDGRMLRRGDLAAMYAERRRLEPLAAREARGRSGPTISRGAGT